ncbi:hypothetical protein IQ31_04174 [Sphingobacterium siyangense]|uniref:Uncharacterized protein n=1 Tax=Sphingobacterium siyangense TaxID=459529 RepID=A0A562M9M0_9SPHI|nr:hypothetical protein IQ31_04174 [Sphingobacterium siyangense]
MPLERVKRYETAGKPGSISLRYGNVYFLKFVIKESYNPIC